MIDEMELRNFAPKTIRLYVDNVARFARHFGKSPDQLDREAVRQYLLHLVQERKVSWGTYKQVLASLRYFYRWVLKQVDPVVDIRGPRREHKLPVVLSLEEIGRFFASVVSYKHRMVLMTAYSAGLRISEAVHLQVGDIDSQRMVIHIRHGKRSKDRYTVLSPLLLQMLRHYWWAARPVNYLFPGRSGQPVSASQVQRSCKEAQAAAGIDKQVTPHTFRHYSGLRTMPGGA
jgi:site-specific recombinase XerD